MSALLHFHEQAEFLRESSGSNVERTLRFTQDVDLIVPDRTLAQEALCLNGFDGGPASCIDPETRVRIDLLPSPERARGCPQMQVSCPRAPFSGQLSESGERLDLGPVALPVPTVVSNEPRILTLVDLISTKLSAYTARGIHRAQDYADVVELMQANTLPRQYGVAEDVRELYERIWDELHSKI